MVVNAVGGDDTVGKDRFEDLLGVGGLNAQPLSRESSRQTRHCADLALTDFFGIFDFLAAVNPYPADLFGDLLAVAGHICYSIAHRKAAARYLHVGKACATVIGDLIDLRTKL